MTTPASNEIDRMRTPGALISCAPVLALCASLAIVVIIAGDGATSGPAQFALVLNGMIAGGIGLSRGVHWGRLEADAFKAVARALPIMVLLLMIGMLIGLWIASGVIPSLVYFGLRFLSPDYIYLAALAICALVSIAVGSSWTTLGTVGLAMTTIGGLLGAPPHIVAGAAISGAYFGDKMSPLSDTTNLAAAVSGADLFEHIRFLLITTAPAFLVAVAFFTALSFEPGGAADLAPAQEITDALEGAFTVNIWLLIPLALTLALAVRRVPAIPALFIGALSAIPFGLHFQSSLQATSVAETLRLLMTAAANGYSLTTGVTEIDSLMSRGGMESFLGTIWLIMAAMFFGGMMQASGSLDVIVRLLMTGAHTGGALMRRAGATSLLSNIITPDQFLSIALPGQMYEGHFRQAGLAPKSLSRVLEDFGTVTSPLVPWNTCGAYVAATLGVSTLQYLPYCVFNLANPVISFVFTVLGVGIARRIDEQGD